MAGIDRCESSPDLLNLSLCDKPNISSQPTSSLTLDFLYTFCKLFNPTYDFLDVFKRFLTNFCMGVLLHLIFCIHYLAPLMIFLVFFCMGDHWVPHLQYSSLSQIHILCMVVLWNVYKHGHNLVLSLHIYFFVCPVAYLGGGHFGMDD